MKKLRLIPIWAACSSLCFVAGQASANGRFPNANQLIVDPADPAHVLVRSTFGVLQTFDAGASWTWICEEAVSPRGFQDPEALIMGDGAILLGLVDGIARGERAGCGWSRELSGIDGRAVNDLIRHPTLSARAYAAVILTLDGLYGGQVLSTSDGGSTWAPTGDVLMDTYPVTLEIARSRPERLYLGANDSSISNGSIGVSDDGGQSFELRAPPAGSDSIYVSAVDPLNADRLYVRSYYPESNLYVSEDAGQSYALIYRSTSSLTGFALSPNGDRVAVGDRESVAVLVRQTSDAGASSYVVERRHPLNVQCLTWTAAGLFACATEASDGFSVGISTDGAQSFSPLLHFADLRPVACAAGTSAAGCAANDCALAALFDASCEAAPLPPEVGAVPPLRGDETRGDAAAPTAPGAPDATPTSAADPAPGAAPSPPPARSRGCDCGLAATPRAAHGAPWALVAVALAVARGRRRLSSRDRTP
jgi:hypothetical protein